MTWLRKFRALLCASCPWPASDFFTEFKAALDKEARDRETREVLLEAAALQQRPCGTGNTELDPVTGREILKQTEL